MSGSKDDGPTLLSGGNPQIPTGDGDQPVRASTRARTSTRTCWPAGSSRQRPSPGGTASDRSLVRT